MLQVTFAAGKQVTSYFCSRKTSYKLLLYQKNKLQFTFAAEKKLQVAFAPEKWVTSYFCTRKPSYKFLFTRKISYKLRLHQQNKLLLQQKNKGDCWYLLVTRANLKARLSDSTCGSVNASHIVFLSVTIFTNRLSGCLQVAFTCQSATARPCFHYY